MGTNHRREMGTNYPGPPTVQRLNQRVRSRVSHVKTFTMISEPF